MVIGQNLELSNDSITTTTVSHVRTTFVTIGREELEIQIVEIKARLEKCSTIDW